MIGMQPVLEMQERRDMRSPGRVVGVLLAVSTFSAQSLAQSVPSVRREFEAATVKASRDNGDGGIRATTGRLTLENVPLRALVSVAYKTRPSQIAGGPSWSDSAKFNIQGKAEEAAGSDPMLLMLQAL